VHLPWCLRKCPYCDFNSHTAPETLPEGRYVAALLADLETELPRIWGRRLESVFLGGGTPSLFSPESMAELIDGLRARLPLRPDTEVTLEANPGTFEQARFRAFRESGINRLSIGVQSLDDALLRRLGRVHDAAEARRAVEQAATAGFDNLNIDLMFGLPGQTLHQADTDLALALSLEPAHLSYYQLTLEPNTLFHHDPPELPDSDTLWEMQQQGHERLSDAGYTRYEVSAFARPGRRCRHNLNYWRFGDYLGIGAGAHGKLTDPASGVVTRRSKQRQPLAYMEAAERGEPDSTVREVDDEDLCFEFMLNALRLNDGFDAALFVQRTGLGMDRIAGPLTEARARGLLEPERRRIRPSALGQRFLNDLTGLFLPT
jgi:oxygen-independent coproporphyrinogen-3 oxidase